MKKFLPVIISDTLFLTFVSFILSFVIFDYLSEKPYSLVFSACFSLLTALLFFKIFTSRAKKKNLAENRREKISSIFYRLCFETKEKNTLRFIRALQKRGFETERKKGGIYLKKEMVTVFIKFGFDSVNKTDVVKAFNNISENEKAVIVAENFTDEIKNFSRLFGNRIILIDGEKIFNLLDSTGELPPPLEKKLPDSDGKSAKRKIGNFLSKKSAKKFLLFGTVFLLTSFLVPLKLYYVISGVVMLIFSAICLLFGKSSAKENQNSI